MGPLVQGTEGNSYGKTGAGGTGPRLWNHLQNHDHGRLDTLEDGDVEHSTQGG
jgi:hypothetical protein